MARNESQAGWSNVLFRREWADTLMKLPEELRLKVCNALFNYILTGEDPEDASILYSPYLAIKTTIESDKENYNKSIVERNRINGQKGGRPRKNPENQEKPRKPSGLEKTQKTQWNPKNPKNPKGRERKGMEGNSIEFSDENIKEVNTSMSATADEQGSVISISGEVEAAKPSQHITRKPSPVDYVRLCDYWNMMMNGKAISQLRSISKKRQTAVNARIKEHSVEAVKVVIDKAAASPFLNGAGGKAWVASFDWIFLHPANFQKVLEGNYDDKSCLLATQPSRQDIEKQQRDMGTVRLMNRLLSENEPVQTTPRYSIASVLDD